MKNIAAGIDHESTVNHWFADETTETGSNQWVNMKLRTAETVVSHIRERLVEQLQMRLALKSKPDDAD